MSYERLRIPEATDDRLTVLRATYPEAFADGRIHWETLRDLLGDEVEDPTVEHFGLSWPGKREARRFANRPSRGALVPVPGEGVNESSTRNVFIEGENLEALKLLRKSYAGRVKMIYIDPPYNTGNDFIYSDDFSEPLDTYLKRTGQADEEGLLTSNPRTDGRYHSNWLNMMFPRLALARDLLTEDGTILVSIGEQEVHHLRSVLSEIFGDENFVATVVWQKSKRGDSKLIAQTHEYILVFTKNKQSVIQNGPWRQDKPGVEEVLAHYKSLRNEFKDQHELIAEKMREWYAGLLDGDVRRKHAHYRNSDERGLYFAADFAGPDDGRTSRPRYDILHPVTGKPCKKPSTGWRWDDERTKRALAASPPLIHFGPDENTIPCRKTYLEQTSSQPFTSVFYRDGRAATLELESILGASIMDFPKSVDVLAELVQLVCDQDSLVMDFFAGSAPLGQAVVQLNAADDGQRRFILVQLPEQTGDNKFPTIAEIGKARLRHFGERLSKTSGDAVDIGFRVYRLGPSYRKQWNSDSQNGLPALVLDFEQTVTPLSDGWSPDDLLVEVILWEGFPLDSLVSRQSQYAENNVRLVTSDFHDHRLWVCLDTEIADATVAQLSPGAEDVFICLDSALTDASKLRLSNICKLRTI